MPRYLVEMDANMLAILKNSRLLALIEHDPLSGYKRKPVSGLYHYDHFEHPDGSFVQVWQGKPKHLVHQDAAGNQRRFEDLASLKAHLSGEKLRTN